MDISNEEIILLKNLLLNLTDQIIQHDGESNKMKEWKDLCHQIRKIFPKQQDETDNTVHSDTDTLPLESEPDTG